MFPLIPLQAYFFKRKRVESNYTLRELSRLLHLDNGYLSKLENNRLLPTQRNIDIMLHFYGIKKYQFDTLHFSSEYIDTVMNKLYYMDFTDNDLKILHNYIEKSKNTVYVGHLYLLLWCYKALYVIWDTKFKMDLKILSELYTSLSEKEQMFFIICKLFYHIRSREHDQSNNCIKILDKMNLDSLFGFNLYVRVCYNFYFNNQLDLPLSIKSCKTKLLKDKNTRRYNAVLMYEAMFNKKVGNFSTAFQLYDNLQNSYLKLRDYTNYAIIHHNLGSLLTSQKKYVEAIQHYEIAIKSCYENDTFFELAWCYYCNKQYDKCSKTIQSAYTVTTKYDVYTLLLDWLMITLSNPCSKRSIDLLLKIKKEYFDSIGSDTKNFVLIALANSYNRIGEFQTANLFLKEILSLQNSYLIEIE